MGKDTNNNELEENTTRGGKTTIDLKKDTAFLKKSKKYAEIYIKQNKDAVMKQILKASNYEKAKELVGKNNTTVKGWSDVMRLNILLRLIRKHFKSKSKDKNKGKNSSYIFNLKATSMEEQDNLPGEFKIGKDTAEEKEKEKYKKNPLHLLITGVDRLLKQKRAEQAYKLIISAKKAELKSKSDKLKHALGKITHAELEKASKETNKTNDMLPAMLEELLTQDISEFKTTIERYDKYDSRKFDVARSFLYTLIEKSTETTDRKKSTLAAIILKKEYQFDNVFAESNNTDQKMKNLLITIQDNVSESKELQAKLAVTFENDCFTKFTENVKKLTDKNFILEEQNEILDNITTCKTTLSTALTPLNENNVAINLTKQLNALNDNVVDRMINLTTTKNLPNGKLTFIPKKLNNINNQSTCGQTLMNYFNSVRTLYAKMKLYYSIDTTLGWDLEDQIASSALNNGLGSTDEVLALITTFKKYEQPLKVQGYGAVNTFISILENDLPNPNPGPNGLDTLKTCLDNAVKPFKCYDLGSNIEDALKCMYEQYKAATIK